MITETYYTRRKKTKIRILIELIKKLVYHIIIYLLNPKLLLSKIVLINLTT